MSWNYRLVKKQSGGFAVHEVYFDKRGKPWSMTQEPVSLYGETAKEVRKEIKMILRDVMKRAVFYEPKEWVR